MTIDLQIAPGSRLHRLHGAENATEHTTCNYGLNPAVQQIASQHGMVVSAVDETGEVRAIERDDHPYFVATLYQPQLRSTPAAPHPVFTGLIAAVTARVG